MKIAYLITAYTDPPQLARLVYALMTDDTDFYIHIDAKVDEGKFKTEIEKKIPSALRNQIVFIKKRDRIRVNWGGYSQVESQLALIREMLASGVQYDWCLNLTGTDYPIWSNRRILDYLSSRNGQPIILGYEFRKMQDSHMEERVNHYYFYDIYPPIIRKVVNRVILYLQRMFGIDKKIKLTDSKWRFCYGGEYWAIPYAMLKMTYEKYMEYGELQTILKTSLIPSEVWCHTTLLSSDFLTEEEKQKIIFPSSEYDGLGSVALLHYFVYGKQIKILGLGDYDNIIKSDKMFMRKAVTGISDELMQRIDMDRGQREC